ncbi:MAG: hypothetical protein JNK93_11005 [Planctomycetia bacterium]|nr:hypothetical protein [Planctomycetia bacterium]
MVLFDFLSHRGPKKYVESWMPMDEVLRRVTARFPLAIVDRERGDRMVRDHLAELIRLDAHTVVLEDWKAMEGHVAYVTIREDAAGPRFHFFLTERPTSIEIEYDREEDRDLCRPLLEALADALGEYALESDDPERPPDLNPDDMPDGVRDTIGEMHLRWEGLEGDIAILAAGPHADGEPFPQASDGLHWCDDSSNVILDLTGFASCSAQDLIEWAQMIIQTAQARDRELRLCYPPGTVDERLTRYFRISHLPIHDSLAEALAAVCE